MSWRDQAACRTGIDPEAFYPELGEHTDAAKARCRRCPVRQPCLDYAVANGERWGVWGGLSERERRRLKRRVA